MDRGTAHNPWSYGELEYPHPMAWSFTGGYFREKRERFFLFSDNFLSFDQCDINLGILSIKK